MALTGILDHVVAYHAEEVLVEGRHDHLFLCHESYSFVRGFLVLFAPNPESYLDALLDLFFLHNVRARSCS